MNHKNTKNKNVANLTNLTVHSPGERNVPGTQFTKMFKTIVTKNNFMANIFFLFLN